MALRDRCQPADRDSSKAAVAHVSQPTQMLASCARHRLTVADMSQPRQMQCSGCLRQPRQMLSSCGMWQLAVTDICLEISRFRRMLASCDVYQLAIAGVYSQERVFFLVWVKVFLWNDLTASPVFLKELNKLRLCRTPPSCLKKNRKCFILHCESFQRCRYLQMEDH